MKKELFALGLLALLLTLSLLNAREIGRLCGGLEDLVDRSADAAQSGDWEESRRLLDEAKSLWKERRGYTGIVLKHSDIETVTDAFFELAAPVYAQDPPAVRAAATLLREHLDSIRRMESINWGSIF